ncbi:MAG: hypothetical protein ACQZ3M_08305 [cyanobacterium endosymbiont of Rhopalodia fuxianensis]
MLGTRPALEVNELGKIPGITVIGQVPSVIEYLHWATVCVISIRNSTRTKIRSIHTLGTR